ncbi:tRNA pseudouridine(54/55) synthase Pus10 [Methanosarcinaceae archaeon]|nr:tRNA pseudouridine(54/55) synthase Pus10 [Methanosarcinaceae archaeon]
MSVLETARKIPAEGPICDHCMGRQFAKLSTGLSNAERGRAVKLMLAMDADRIFKEEGNSDVLKELAPSCSNARRTLSRDDRSEDAKCWVCGDIFKNLDFWADMAVQKLEGLEYRTLLVGTKLSGLLAENEEILWEACGAAYAEQLKSELNREIGKIIAAKTGKEAALSNPDVMITFDIAEKTVDISVRSVYIYGRYNKNVRGIPQTHWPCRDCHGKGCEKCGNTGKQYPESVEELMSIHLIPMADAEGAAFHGAGREDIDALMLGTGRPFVLEAKAPRIRSIDLASLRDAINTKSDGKIHVSDLQFCDKKVVERLKSEKALKSYRMKIRFDEPVPEALLLEKLAFLKGKEINQDTPTRVMHRRADLCRNRTVHEAVLESVDGDVAYVRVLCDGGLYVKELTSGDNGRTNPSISGLVGVHGFVEELDVINVDIDAGLS